MPDVVAPGPTRFDADATHRRHHRRRVVLWMAGAVLLLLPGAGLLGVGFVLKLVDPSQAFMPMLLGWLCVFVLGVPALVALIVAAGLAFEKHTRVEIDADGTVHVPGSKVQGLHTHQLRDGYRYAARIDQVLVCVPAARVVAVRRVDDPEEVRAGAAQAPRPGWGCLMLPFMPLVRAGGHQLMGPGAAEQAPQLLEQALKRSWVTDAARAVAITFDVLKADGNPWLDMPKELERPTLYVSVEDPDGLVAALTAARKGADPVA